MCIKIKHDMNTIMFYSLKPYAMVYIWMHVGGHFTYHATMVVLQHIEQRIEQPIHNKQLYANYASILGVALGYIYGRTIFYLTYLF
jgi:hypothetical protein